MNLVLFFVQLGKVAERYNARTVWDVRNRRGTLTLPASCNPWAVQVLAKAMADEVELFGACPPHCVDVAGAVVTVTCPE